MATITQAVNKIKNSDIQLIVGNTDIINECMRRHLRKLKKMVLGKSKKTMPILLLTRANWAKKR
jgi:hypothetical protein